jgi:hypothetical protein
MCFLKDKKKSVPVSLALYHGIFMLKSNVDTSIELDAIMCNNSKTVSNMKNLTWGKYDQHIKIYLPCNFEVNLITHLGVIALFSSNL